MATADQLKQGGNAAKLGAMSPPPLARGFTPASGNSSTPKLGAARAHPVGKIEGKGTGTSDQVPINASNGEFIIKAAAVKIIGLEALEALNAVADGPDEKDSKAEAVAEYGDAKGMKCGGKVKGMATGGLIDEKKKNSFGDAASGANILPGNTLPEVIANSPQRLMGTPATAPVNNRSGAGYVAPTAPAAPAVTQQPPALTATAGSMPFQSGTAAMFRDTRAADKSITGVTGVPSAVTSPQTSQSGGATGAWDAPHPRGMANQAASAQAIPAAPTPFDRSGQQGTEVDRMKVYQDANQKANDLAPSWFSQKTPTSEANLAQAKQAADAAYKNIYAPTPSAANPVAPAGAAPVASDFVSPPVTPVAEKPAPSPAMPGQAAPVGMPSPGQVTKTMQPNGVTSYSGENVTGDINLAGNRGGVISAQNNRAAENLARASGQTRGFGPSGAIRGGGQVSSMDTSAGYAADLKQLAGIDAAKAEQNANMQAQADYAANKVLEGRALGGNRSALQLMGNNQRAKSDQRGQDIQAGAARDSNKLAQENQKLAVAKDGREATAAGFTSRSAGRIEALQASYEAAKPEDRAAIAEQLRVMTGKEKAVRSLVVPGGQAMDKNGVAFNMASSVYDPDTKQFIKQGAEQTQKAEPHAQDIARLKANPKEAAMFEQIYGAGAANQYLGK